MKRKLSIFARGLQRLRPGDVAIVMRIRGGDFVELVRVPRSLLHGPKGNRVGDEARLKTEVTAGTAARILSRPIIEIERMCEEGKLRARRIGERGWWRIEYASVLEWFAKERA